MRYQLFANAETGESPTPRIPDAPNRLKTTSNNESAPFPSASLLLIGAREGRSQVSEEQAPEPGLGGAGSGGGAEASEEREALKKKRKDFVQMGQNVNIIISF